MTGKPNHQSAAIWIAASALCLMAMRAGGETLNTAQVNWGSLHFSGIVDSNGNQIQPGGFFFELGAFNTGFTPNESNVTQWAANWHAFDSADYVVSSPTTSVFASSYDFYYDSTTGETNGDFEARGISRDAYMWVYNSTVPVHGTQWFLARSTSWVFPEVTGACCANSTPLQWSLEDLGTTSPVIGNQLGNESPFGENHVFDPDADLQTYTFIPEPSSALLVGLSGIVMALRRKRQPQAS